MSSRDIDLLCFGEAIVDLMPDRTGVPLSQVEVFHRCLGGALANVAVATVRLGRSSALVTLVGADELGKYIRNALSSEGVDVSCVGVHKTARTGIALVSVEADGPHFAFYRNPSADMLITTVEVSRVPFARSRVFHFGSSTLAREPARAATLAALADAREEGCLVSCDPNWRGHLWSEPAEAKGLIQQTLSDCDFVKMAEEEAIELLGPGSPAELARALRDLGVTIAVVTLGARGVYVESPAGGALVPGETVKLVDPTGAGDAFVAGFWCALLPALEERELGALALDPIRKACVFGNRVASRVVGALGAIAGLPKKGETP